MIGRVLRRAALPALLALAAPAAAHAAGGTSVTMFSDSGDWVGAGQQRLFTPALGSVSAKENRGGVTVGVSGGTAGDSYSMEFDAAPGKALVPGVYDRAQRAPFREAGRPGIDIDGDGRGCNTIDGRFEVKDFLRGSRGAVRRLWIVYEQHCEGGRPALFGEVRINEHSAAAAPTIVRWPPGDRGGKGTAVPVTFAPGRSLHVAHVSVTGADAGDFPLRVDDCGGRSLAAGASCEVWTRFAPQHSGTRRATLRIVDSAGRTYDSALQGFSYGGVTKVTMHSDPGDYIGGGRDYSFTPDSARIDAGGTRRHVGFALDGPKGDWWYADFAPASGDILAPGTYDGASRYPFQGTGPGLDVSGDGRGCNELSGKFTVTDASFEPDGSLHSFGARFEQHCEHADAALRGEFDFRAGDRTAPAPWMVSRLYAKKHHRKRCSAHHRKGKKKKRCRKHKHH